MASSELRGFYAEESSGLSIVSSSSDILMVRQVPTLTATLLSHNKHLNTNQFVCALSQLFAKLVFLVGGFALGPLVNVALLVELFRHSACDSLPYALYALVSFADILVRPHLHIFQYECD